jgi:hypothetical protein
VNVLYAGDPVTIHWWSVEDNAGSSAVVGVIEIAETEAGSLVMRTDTERVLCPAGTWGRIAWPVTDPTRVRVTP